MEDEILRDRMTAIDEPQLISVLDAASLLELAVCVASRGIAHVARQRLRDHLLYDGDQRNPLIVNQVLQDRRQPRSRSRVHERFPSLRSVGNLT